MLVDPIMFIGVQKYCPHKFSDISLICSLLANFSAIPTILRLISKDYKMNHIKKTPLLVKRPECAHIQHVVNSVCSL